MVSRWYRPPEVILCTNNYGTKIDIWGLGCLFYEIHKTWSSSDGFCEDRILFRGDSCYPQSPKYKF